tara:strand:- start:22283 stop:22492 length:210 start_codon:yes stop_codon:yes gene_type:complete
MKLHKILILSIVLFITYSCDSDSLDCQYNGYELITGPEGGRYYWNSNGNKTYVDRSCCEESCNNPNCNS